MGDEMEDLEVMQCLSKKSGSCSHKSGTCLAYSRTCAKKSATCEEYFTSRANGQAKRVNHAE